MKHANVPGASSAAGWVEALQYSSKLIHLILYFKQAVDPPPAPDAPPNAAPHDDGEAAAACQYRRVCFKLLAALLRADAVASLSRLLAAEQHRGTAAVLDTGAAVDVLWPLADLVCIARSSPTELLPTGSGQEQQQQPQLVGPAVLRALAASGVVEHVCRFAVTRLVGQQAAKGTGRAAGHYHEHCAFVRGLMDEVSLLACDALTEGRGDAADAWAVLLSPCFQVGRYRAWQDAGYPAACCLKAAFSLHSALTLLY